MVHFFLQRTIYFCLSIFLAAKLSLQAVKQVQDGKEHQSLMCSQFNGTVNIWGLVFLLKNVQ